VPRGASEAERRELARLRAGQDALRQWLDAPERVPRRAVPAVARHVLGVAMALAVLAAVLVHPVFLVVLIPVAIPFAFLGLSRQDADWLRLGAARHYQETGLRPPGAWEEGAVRERAEALAAEAGDLEARMRRKDAAAMPAAEPPEEADEAALAVALLEAREEAEAALAAARVSRADAEGPLGDYLEALARLRGIEQALARLRARRRSLEREAEDLRGRVLAWLGRHGTVPPHGAADAGHLAEALEEAAAPRSGV
jgi:hypothetical protein